MTNEDLKQETNSTTNENSTMKNLNKGVHHRNYNKKNNTSKDNANTKSLVKANKKNENMMNVKKSEKSLVKVEHKAMTKKDDFRFKKPSIKIIPLGGLEEIGKNITVFEYENDILIVDCGLEFPTDDMLGIDLVIPDVSYLVKNKDKIRGMVITHGHEDHIGSIPYVLQQVNMPIYATKLTVGLIKGKLEEHHLLRSTKLIEVEQFILEILKSIIHQ